jgi:hypothetical protein
MALQNVREKASNSNFRKATEIEVGETVSGYLVGLPANRFNENEKDIVLRNKESGEETRIATAGQLKRDVNDGYLILGQFTSITRLKDRKEKSKDGKAYTLTDFDTQQDSEDITSDLSFDTSTSAPKTATVHMTSKVDVRAQAAALKEQAKS